MPGFDIEGQIHHRFSEGRREGDIYSVRHERVMYYGGEFSTLETCIDTYYCDGKWHTSVTGFPLGPCSSSVPTVGSLPCKE